MTNEEHLKELKATDDILLSDLYEALDEELSKTESKQDHEVIYELSRAICEIKGVDVTDEEVASGKVKILSKINSKDSVTKKIFKFITYLAASAAAVFVLNIFTVNAFNISIFPKYYERTDGSIVIFFNNDKVQTEDNLKFIQAKCCDYGINDLIPTYLPNGYEIVNYSFEDNCLSFWLKNNNEKINIYYDFYQNNGSWGIPSDEGQFKEIELGKHSFFISYEDGQIRAIAISPKYHILLTSYDLDYDETYKILSSLN